MKEKTSQNKIQKNSEKIQTKIQKRKHKNSETNSDDNLEAQNKKSDENSEAHFENSEKTQRKIQDEFQSFSERFLQRFLNVAFPFCRCGVELVSRWELDVERREWNETFNLHDETDRQASRSIVAHLRKIPYYFAKRANFIGNVVSKCACSLQFLFLFLRNVALSAG